MSQQSPDVIVVGGGIEGLATAWALTERGVGDVLVLERSSLASAGTGKSSSIVRCHYGVPSLAAMALRGTEVLEQADAILGAPVSFEQVGYVVAVGPENLAPFTASIETQQRLGVDTRFVTADDVESLWPDLHVDDFAAPDVPEWDWPRFRVQVLEPLLAGRPARYQVGRWDRGVGDEWLEIAPGSIVVVEGVSSTRREVGAPWSLTVWVDAPPEVRRGRAIARDGAALWPVWERRWLPPEQDYARRERPQERVDLIVDGTVR